jgi:hypothetical protein
MKQPMTLSAISAAPRALEWLNTTRTAHPLHIFDQVVNLVNQDARVLSIVSPIAGNGPFSLVLNEGGFLELVSLKSPISFEQDVLMVGELSIDCSHLEPWTPRPAWIPLTQSQIKHLQQRISAELDAIKAALNFPEVLSSVGERVQLGSGFLREASQAMEQIRTGFELVERQPILNGAAKLAGLGMGLTPAGDDFLIGMFHGLWARARQDAEPLCRAIADIAIRRTGTLSANWLDAASQGEATQTWHNFLEAVWVGDEDRLHSSLEEILHTGETSGADALSGFTFILKQEQVL